MTSPVQRLPGGTCVIGHANPDTDSVASAIAYSRLLQFQGESDAFPARQGELRPDTAWALENCDVESPVLVQDVRPRVGDIMATPVKTIDENSTLLEASRVFGEQNLHSLPIVNASGALAGVLRLEDFARFFLEGQATLDGIGGPLDLDAIVRSIGGTVLVEERGRPLNRRVQVAASSIHIVLERIPSNGVAVLGDRHDAQEALLQRGVGALVVTGELPVPEDILNLARAQHTAVVSSPLNTYDTIRRISLSAPVSRVMHSDAVTCTADMFADDIRPMLTSQRALPVVDERHKVAGIVSRTDLLRPSRRKVAMVDHNERSQAVAGLDSAEVVAIIDHHRVATVQTGSPIMIRFEPLGATATIIWKLYREAGVPLPKEVAGLLLSAIVTDTVIFRSPTATKQDRTAAQALAAIAGLDPEAFGRELLTRGSDIRGVSPRELLLRDFKEFPIGGHLYGIAAVETADARSVHSIRAELKRELQVLRDERPYEVALCMIVDVLQEETELLISGHEQEVADVFETSLVASGVAVLPFVASRKKQIVPLLEPLDQRIRALTRR